MKTTAFPGTSCQPMLDLHEAFRTSTSGALGLGQARRSGGAGDPHPRSHDLITCTSARAL